MATLADRVPPSLRGLVRHKRFAALAIVSLGVAIALNTTMYSVMDAVLFPRVAMRQPENLYRLPFFGDGRGRIPVEALLDVYTQFSFYEGIAYRNPYAGGAGNFAESGTQSRTARVVEVSSNYFELLGARASAGRLLNQADINSPARPVVVSERFWRQMFPARTKFDTATFTIDDNPRTIVGVLPYEADFPGEFTDVWQLPLSGDVRQPSLRVFNVVRLKPNLSIRDAFVELNGVASRLAVSIGDKPTNARFDLVKMINGPLRIENFHIATIGAVLFVLLIACFNLANLQLARGLGRTKELATRAAVGATRGSLIRLLVGEAAWIAAAGVTAGVLLAFWGMQLVRSSLPPSFESFAIQPQVSWRLFAFATAVGAMSLTIVGLLPALRVSRVDVNELLKSGSGTGSTRKTRWQAGALVVFQVALALSLVVGASLLLRAAATLYSLDINPTLEHIATARVLVTPAGANDHRVIADVSTQLVARARTVSGVVEAATARTVSAGHQTLSVSTDGALPREVPTGTQWYYRIVSDAYVRTYGYTITKGRDFSPAEVGKSVIVDAQTARYLWPNNDPLGRQIKFGSDTRHDEGWFTVVGVVDYFNTWSAFRTADQSQRLEPQLGIVLVVSGADTGHVYHGATGQGRLRYTNIEVSVRGTDKVERLPMLLRRSLTDLSLGFRVNYADRLTAVLSLDFARSRQEFVAGLFSIFAILALGLAALGVYAVVSHTVSQRIREFGVRIALGANNAQIRQTVLHHGNVLALGGIALGLFIAWPLSGLLSAFLNSGSAWDYVSMFVLAPTILFGVTLFASYVPARRAMRVNPVEALRAE